MHSLPTHTHAQFLLLVLAAHALAKRERPVNATFGGFTFPAGTIEQLATEFTGHLSIPNGCLINPEDLPDGSPSQNLAALWLRAAFHDVGKYDPKNPGQPVSGLLPNYLDQVENAGIAQSIATRFAPVVKFNFSRADYIALGAQVSITHCGGPSFDFMMYREDAPHNTPFASLPHALPDDAVDSYELMKQKLYRLGLSNQEIVLLVTGSHSLGGAHKVTSPHATNKTFQAFDSSPGVFDNVIFKEMRAGRCVLNIDCGIMRDGAMKTWIELYASDEAAFFKDYALAFNKMANLGQDETSLEAVVLDVPVHKNLVVEGSLLATTASSSASTNTNTKSGGIQFRLNGALWILSIITPFMFF
ncbi:hypothetical protein CcCBS67573_g05935 [Chytriomyces confervae]|uniref:Peroxidase n=1 Tax=Chytriomyces confervae TaxID=246404 RepID=A0A507F7F5_9FUNG|nr:L-ascorbate peroxidase 3 [Chytriomyces hyalinus]TPX72064.1 hypothetical protein CcCBS67573_g05935 [Chytriomyces confervae]